MKSKFQCKKALQTSKFAQTSPKLISKLRTSFCTFFLVHMHAPNEYFFASKRHFLDVKELKKLAEQTTIKVRVCACTKKS